MVKHSIPGLSVAFLNGLFVLAFAPGLRADVTGSILGTATDSSSAVVQGVVVVATNLDTNLSQATRTDAAGQYRILVCPSESTRSRRRFQASRNFW